MKVWIVEAGLHESRSIEGVYATREAAIAANPPAREGRLHEPPTEFPSERPGGWQPDDPYNPATTVWWNGLDEDEARTMWPEKVKQ